MMSLSFEVDLRPLLLWVPVASVVLKDLSPAPGAETIHRRAGGQQALHLTLTVDPSSSPRAVGGSRHSLSSQT